MDDLMIQFARLWGMTEAMIVTSEDERISKELKSYDSVELKSLIQQWADEFLCNEEEDTVEFFEMKIKELMSKN